ncbi:heavy metal-responsive transcriptional regulator [Nitrospinae bacterium AH_259_B05_G02_I21]|nr:heavy metal-responsive transcriptional regulator [Nitrospinae bacterium AH_259_B05_G02_I21]MDA2932526.1 heavy metal-responsive transcriptional regulator [Nitrospinae bacterium AH-259-F20]
MTDGQKLLIGEAARRADLNPKTIRFYEEIGLIAPTGRTTSGYRLFDEEGVSRLAFIRKAQALGFTLAEIREILALRDVGSMPCDHVEVKINQKVGSIEERIAELEQLKASLTTLLERWKEAEAASAAVCPQIEGA